MDIEKSVKHYSEWLHHEVSAATREAAWPLVERLVKKESTVPVEKLLADVRQTVKGIYLLSPTTVGLFSKNLKYNVPICSLMINALGRSFSSYAA